MLARVIAAVIAVLAVFAPAGAEERIQRFISDVEVQHNGDLLVAETIAIRAEGRQIRRGILRDFPTTYRRADGSRVQVGFDVMEVLRDGLTEPFSTERMANGVRVRIGRGDRTINPGVHQYVIRYRTTRQIGFFRDYDELYWNATGNAWTFPIDVAEARIVLPERVRFIQNALYTGPQGSRGEDATVVEQEPGRIVFRTTRALPVGHGLTVAAAWPKGVVAEPTPQQRWQAMLQDDPALVTAAVGGGLVIGYYLLAWLMLGRDPRRGTIIPLFAPPKGMSAAAVRYVHEMGFDDRVFTAAIVGLGVNGCLKLVDRGGDREVRHIKGGRPIDQAEQATEQALFADGATVALDKSEHSAIGGARGALASSLKSNYAGILFKNHFWWSSLGLIGAVIAIVSIAASYGDSYGSNSGGIFVGMLLPILPVMFGVSLIRNGLHQGGDRGRARVIVGLLVIAGALAIGIAILGHVAGFGPAIVPALVPSVLAAFASLGFGWLQAPTQEGRKLMDQIDGFKQYLSVAEESRLEYLNPPEKTPALFEKFLPYAIALNVENSWANRFTQVLAAAGVAAAVSSWYSSDTDFSTSDITSFTDRVSDKLSDTIASAATPPGSTGSDWGGSSGDSGGSSGGGDSGGGGGGGGGSGW